LNYAKQNQRNDIGVIDRDFASFSRLHDSKGFVDKQKSTRTTLDQQGFF